MSAKKCWWVIVMALFLAASAATADDTHVTAPSGPAVGVVR